MRARWKLLAAVVRGRRVRRSVRERLQVRASALLYPSLRWEKQKTLLLYPGTRLRDQELFRRRLWAIRGQPEN